MESIAIRPSGPVQATIRPPGSKSITNRALVCAALAVGDSTLAGALDSEDTRVMIAALGRLGIGVEHDTASATIRVAGCGGHFPTEAAELYAANSGTTIRFLTALLALGRGVFRLDGTARMRQRPIQDLLDAMRQLGADVVAELGNGCPPVVVRAAGLPGGRATVSGSISSQFLSGLLMAAPYAQSPVELGVNGDLVSRPYIDMTLAVMRSFGVAVETPGSQTPSVLRVPRVACPPVFPTLLVKPAVAPNSTSSVCRANIAAAAAESPCRFLVAAPQHYTGRRYDIEPDASAASYFFAAAAITQGTVTVEGLGRSSIQGDVAFCECLRQMGCEVQYGDNRITVVGRPLRGITVDMNAISDTVQTLGAVALFADGPTTVHGVGHIRHKETDRIRALATELRKFDAAVEEREDGLTITPGSQSGDAVAIDTYDDHRMAMSMALVGLARRGVSIRYPGCTAKTYPGFFSDLEKLCVGGRVCPRQ